MEFPIERSDHIVKRVVVCGVPMLDCDCKAVTSRAYPTEAIYGAAEVGVRRGSWARRS